MNILNKLDKRYAIGILIGLIFGLLSVYVDFFKRSRPDLTIDILNNTTVFDIKEKVGNLDVFYDSSSLTRKNRTLSLITLRISNNGDEPVLKEYFDTLYPLQIIVDSSTIVQLPQIIETNEPYFNSSLQYSLTNSNQLIFKPFIFDKDKFFIIKIIAIHSLDIVPTIEVKGKIAKIDHFNVYNSFKDSEKSSFLKRVFNGSLGIHVTRFFSYFFILGISMMLIVLPISAIVDYFSKMKRKKLIYLFNKMYTKREIGRKEDILLNFYIDNGNYAIQRFRDIVANQNRLKKHIFLSQDRNDPYYKHIRERNPIDLEIEILIKDLKKQNLIKPIENKYVIDPDYLTFIKDLISFVKK